MKIEVVCPELAKSEAAKKLQGKKIIGRSDGFPPTQVWQFHYDQTKLHVCNKDCPSMAVTFEKEMT
jgi:hypothetical protein